MIYIMKWIMVIKTITIFSLIFLLGVCIGSNIKHYEDKADIDDPKRIEYEKAIKNWDGAYVIPEVKVPKYGWKQRKWE